jgi:S1-C subfamily serine protease
MSPISLVRLWFGLAFGALLAGCGTTSPMGSGLEAFHQAAVLIEHPHGHGTGIILGPRTVLTAHHVVRQSPVQVTFFNGPVASGEIVWQDETLDLALIDVAVPAEYRAVELACSDLQAGQQLLSIGHPTQSRWVAVAGYLPSTVRFGGGDLVALGFPIGLGTSGGPVVDTQGRVAGVALAILAERSSASAVFDRYKDTGIGLMLPAADFCPAIASRLDAHRL